MDNCLDGVCGCELELQPHNLRVPCSIPVSGVTRGTVFIGPYSWIEYWWSFQEAELRALSCKVLFVYQCKMTFTCNPFQHDPNFQ